MTHASAPREKNQKSQDPLALTLRRHGLRPTRPRLALARLLFGQGDRHVTAEMLHEEAKKAGIKLALATVYNSLHQFTDAGLLREITLQPGRVHFDTNLSDHHHFYLEDQGVLMDIPASQLAAPQLPNLPQGTKVKSVEVIIRLQSQD